jgi:AcrR family transcriptional regulator
VSVSSPRAWTRDPDRKQKILQATAELVGPAGYHAVSMADIGSAAGVTAAAIYRHFDSKAALLAAVFDQVIDRLRREQGRIISGTSDPVDALRQVVDGQVEFVVANRDLARVYIREIENLPDADRRRLRRKQRAYVEEWVALVMTLRGQGEQDVARATAHAAIGAIQSTLLYTSGLSEPDLRRVLRQAGLAVLGLPASCST